jgi:hypothetical protein
VMRNMSNPALTRFRRGVELSCMAWFYFDKNQRNVARLRPIS